MDTPMWAERKALAKVKNFMISRRQMSVHENELLLGGPNQKRGNYVTSWLHDNI